MRALPPLSHRFDEKDVQRDAKLVSYDIVDRGSKPYVSVDVGGEKKVCVLGVAGCWLCVGGCSQLPLNACLPDPAVCLESGQLIDSWLLF